MAEKVLGSVKWFDDARGYGFITPDGGPQDAFVHYKDIVGQTGRKSLVEGERVTMEIARTNRGPKALNVQVIRENVFRED